MNSSGLGLEPQPSALSLAALPPSEIFSSYIRSSSILFILGHRHHLQCTRLVSGNLIMDQICQAKESRSTVRLNSVLALGSAMGPCTIGSSGTPRDLICRDVPILLLVVRAGDGHVPKPKTTECTPLLLACEAYLSIAMCMSTHVLREVH